MVYTLEWPPRSCFLSFAHKGNQRSTLLLSSRSTWTSSCRPHATSLGYLSSVGIYEDKNAYPSAADVPKIKIFRFEENIFYANVDMFKKLFTKRIGFRIDDQLKAMTNEINAIEHEHKLRLAKPKNHTFAQFKRRLQKNGATQPEAIGNDEAITIDEKELLEEKNKKV